MQIKVQVQHLQMQVPSLCLRHFPIWQLWVLVGLVLKAQKHLLFLVSKSSSYSVVKNALLKVFAKLGIDGPLPKMKDGRWEVHKEAIKIKVTV
ncbi:MAG: hypothetical protein IPI90_09605 [Saprospiraceae bacterium]|nr:hypothetical protein [Candidatus Vicinibacter affinis]